MAPGPAMRVSGTVSRVRARFAKPQAPGVTRGLLSLRPGSNSDASLGAPGRVRGGGDARGAGAGAGEGDAPLAAGAGRAHRLLPPPAGDSPGRPPGEVPERRVQERGAARRQRATGQQPPAMSRGLQLLLLSCGRSRGCLSASLPPPAPHRPATPPFLACSRSSLPLVACSLTPAAWEMTVACSEDVELPCTAPRYPQIPYTVSWAKLTERGEEKIEVPQEDLQNYHQKEPNGSFERPGERLYALKIQKTTGCSSGTYICTLVGPEGQRNQSGTVILKVTACHKDCKEETFKKYRAEIVLLLALVVFYLTLIIFTCKFARQQSIFPDFSKPGLERVFLPVTSPNKHLEPVTLHKTEVV
uniref:Ig-like domain-containing protein n=2 Tax=Rhinolophus ferrumequinum TaxID=59479 RepID=A0A671FA75_RHIFE